MHDVSVDTKVDPRKYGAVCDGAADDTAALHAALDAASAAGGGTVVLPPGKIGISDVVDVPMWVNLVGVAAGINSAATTAGSTLVALHADAQLRFGFVGATPRGGMSGNFSIDGRDLAGAGGLLHVHHSVQRTFQQIEVCDSIGDGIVLDRTQNSVYVNLRALRCVGDGIRLDRSAGNNTLIGCGARKIGGAHIRFGAQDNGSGGDVTFGNVFLGGVFEEFYDGTGQSTAVLLVESSRGNIIDGLNLVNGGTLTGAESAVVQVMAGTLMMSRCRMTGQTVNDGVYVAPGATCIATANAFQNCPNAYVVDAGSSLSNTDDFGSYTNLYRVVSGGDASGVFRRSRSTLRFDLDPTLGGAWIQARLAGDSFARVIVNDGNGLAFGSGSAAVDTALRRQNQHQLRTPDFFEALGGLRTLAKTGGAVTNADFPDLASPPGSGTIAVDEDNNRLYVKVGSTWRYVDLT